MELTTFSFDAPTPPDLLDRSLRGELAAASTYEQALHHVQDPKLRMALEKNRRSHTTRSVALTQMVRRQGEDPSSKAGAWGAFTLLVERGASLVGDTAIVEVLHEGEMLLTATYEARAKDLDEESVTSFRRHVLDPQRQCQRRIAETLPS